MALPEDVFLVEDANNDDADWDDDRPKAEPPPGVSAMPIEAHIMTWDDAVVSMKHDFTEAIPVHPTPSHSMLIEFLDEDLVDSFLTGTIFPQSVTTKSYKRWHSSRCLCHPLQGMIQRWSSWNTPCCSLNTL